MGKKNALKIDKESLENALTEVKLKVVEYEKLKRQMQKKEELLNDLESRIKQMEEDMVERKLLDATQLELVEKTKVHSENLSFACLKFFILLGMCMC